jgi:tetratricopeptide (TPR) repeat protein
MGFSLRKIGDYKQALTFYNKALDFDAVHKGAHEYLGELYVETGQVDKAKEQLAVLSKICPAGCEELTDLQHAIARAPKIN